MPLVEQHVVNLTLTVREETGDDSIHCQADGRGPKLGLVTESKGIARSSADVVHSITLRPHRSLHSFSVGHDASLIEFWVVSGKGRDRVSGWVSFRDLRLSDPPTTHILSSHHSNRPRTIYFWATCITCTAPKVPVLQFPFRCSRFHV